MWKKSITFAFALSLVFPVTSHADTWVDGYVRDDGTYVEGHYRSDADGYFFNNWSTEGNVNPYSGEWGTKSYDSYDWSTDSNYDSSSSFDRSSDYDYDFDSDYSSDFDTDFDSGFDSDIDTGFDSDLDLDW